jgi:dTDP-L-rhamnose 4-epimerase
MKVLVTGGAGFIDRHLTLEFANEGHEIVWLDNRDPQVHGDIAPDGFALPALELTLIVGGVRDRQTWVQAIEKVDSIVHFAAQTGTGQSMYQFDRYTDVNIGGTALMWDVLANESHQVKKILIASSRSICGEGAYSCFAECGRVVPEPRTKGQLTEHHWSPVRPKCGATVEPIATSENSIPQPASLYACTKLAQEQIYLTMGKALDISTIAFRFQNVFGPGQSLQNPYTDIISIFSNQMRQNLPINIYEDGQETRDFIFVNDVAKVCQLALSCHHENLVLNVGSGVATKVIDLAQNLKGL